jgi:hypothetical protein
MPEDKDKDKHNNHKHKNHKHKKSNSVFIKQVGLEEIITIYDELIKKTNPELVDLLKFVHNEIKGNDLNIKKLKIIKQFFDEKTDRKIAKLNLEHTNNINEHINNINELNKDINKLNKDINELNKNINDLTTENKKIAEYKTIINNLTNINDKLSISNNEIQNKLKIYESNLKNKYVAIEEWTKVLSDYQTLKYSFNENAVKFGFNNV